MSGPSSTSRPDVVVVAAILVEGGRVLVTQRMAADRFPHLWEFPGGKVEPGESHREALVRELREELDIGVRVEDLYDRIRYRAETGALLEILFYRASREEGEPREVEVADWLWAAPADLLEREFIPSNRGVVERLAAELPSDDAAR